MAASNRIRRARLARRASLGAVLGAMLASACGGGEPPGATAGARLPALPIAEGTVTVSGISAGGYMAVQFHVANSALVQGAGVVAAGPYYCAENSMRHALGRCMKGDSDIPVDELLGITSQSALDGNIDPIAGLADDRVWIFHGAVDALVAKPVVDALQAYYAGLVDPEHIARVEHATANHTFPTRDPSVAACGSIEPPFVGNCGVDGARTLLEYLYGAFAPAAATGQAGELRAFDQSGYARDAGSSGLAAEGWLYVPAACKARQGDATCRLHVVFHGCKQGASFVQDAFVRRSGYLAAADAGRVVMLFPQVQPSFQPLNPNGCWDWWGYEGQWYAAKTGPQVAAVRRMVGDLLGERPAP